MNNTDVDNFDDISIDDDSVEDDIEIIEGDEAEDEAEADDDQDDNDFQINIDKDNESKIITIDDTYNKYYSNKKITKPYITKFEKAKMIGTRAEMISSGSIPLVKVPKDCDSAYKIALIEFEQKKIPLLIMRKLPNNNTELWRLDELIY